MQPELNLDIRRKRTFFIYSNLVLGAVFIVLGCLNYIDGLIQDLAVDIIVVALCAIPTLAMRFVNADRAIYRFNFAVVCLLFLYSIEAGIGKDTILYYIFAMPPLLFFYFGKREGTLWVLFFFIAIVTAILTPAVFHRHHFGYFNVSRFFISISIVIITSYGIESARHTFSRLLDEKNKALLAENLRLENALKEIKTLSGLIPICASCKKIRNDQGYWQQVEIYLKEHSTADFSHGVCPDCIRALYPQFEPGKNIT